MPTQTWIGPRTTSGTAHQIQNLHVTPRSHILGDVRRIPSQSDSPRPRHRPNLFQRHLQTPLRLPLLSLTPISIRQAQARIPPSRNQVNQAQPKADGPWSENRTFRKTAWSGRPPSLPTCTAMPTSMVTWSWVTLTRKSWNLAPRAKSDQSEAQSNLMPRRS